MALLTSLCCLLAFTWWHACLTSAIDKIFIPHSQQPYTIMTSFTNYDARVSMFYNKSIIAVTLNYVGRLENPSGELLFSRL